MKQIILALSATGLLIGCNSLQWNSDILGGSQSSGAQPVVTDPGAPLSAIPSDETSVGGAAALQPNSGAATTQVTPPSSTSSFQGRASTVASLGDPAIPGYWMETSLVSSEQLARLRSSTGKEVTVTLRPAPAGSSAAGRLSINAMRALGAPLTELVEIEVLPAG